MSAQSSLDSCSIGALCQRNVVCVDEQEHVLAAAERMRAEHVGCLIVTEPLVGSESGRVIGILTDRDIVVSVVARKADPSSLKVGDVMSRNPLMVAEDTSLDAALSFMQDAGVRRVAVTGERGELIGIVSLDDVLGRIAEQLGKVCGSIRNEIRTERLVRP